MLNLCQDSPEHRKVTEALNPGLYNLRARCTLSGIHVSRPSLSISFLTSIGIAIRNFIKATSNRLKS